MPPSTISQESIPRPDLLAHFHRLSYVSDLSAPFLSTNTSSYTSHLSKFLYSNGFPSSLYLQRTRRPVFFCGLTSSSSKFQSLWNEYNRFLRFHCGLVPIGHAYNGFPSNGTNLVDNGNVVHEDDVLPSNAVDVETPKKVLILMSDTGGGHRASAEAIKDAFNQEFGDEYQVFVTDLWSDHTPWPFNQLPRSYNFLVKHGTLWKMTYYGSAPRLVHQSNFAATSAFIARLLNCP